MASSSFSTYLTQFTMCLYLPYLQHRCQGGDGYDRVSFRGPEPRQGFRTLRITPDRPDRHITVV
jgi:hypothetical protein